MKSTESRSSRRLFLTQVSSAAALVGTAVGKNSPLEKTQGEMIPLPSIALGPHRISRLIAGWNPIGGYSYLGPNMDQHMREYFTEERTAEFLLRCEGQGISAHQYDPTPMMTQALRQVREAGSTMKFVCLHSVGSRFGSIDKVVAETNPIAFAHHGGVTDRLFREGKANQIHDYVKKVHDAGLLAGISAHNPDNIKRIADAGWENDFFMTCFHYLTRLNDHPELEAEKKVIGKAFYKSDPKTMSAVMRQVEQPCLGFKILAAGRASFSRKGVAEAFEYAFRHIKETDAVIVGMYPRFRDEIQENTKLTRRFGEPGCFTT
jgi:hypothetical protein